MVRSATLKTKSGPSASEPLLVAVRQPIRQALDVGFQQDVPFGMGPMNDSFVPIALKKSESAAGMAVV
jgi:hypothetical protein